MSEEQYQRLMDELIAMYGDSLPSPVHEPMQFHHILKTLKYYHGDIVDRIVSNT